MPLSAEQKEILKERMKLAREAKVAKKAKNVSVIESKQPEPVAAVAPVVVAPVEKPVEKVWSRPRHEPLPEETQKLPVKTPRSKPIKIPTVEQKETKTKYAKLVFYQEPGNNKKIKKLTKVLEQSSSDEEEPAPVVETKVQPTPQVVDPEERYKKLARMSRLFFD